MRRSLKEFLGNDLKFPHGIRGRVNDFLIEEEGLEIKCLKADLESCFNGKEIVLPKSKWTNPSWTKPEFEACVSKDEIKENLLTKTSSQTIHSYPNNRNSNNKIVTNIHNRQKVERKMYLESENSLLKDFSNLKSYNDLGGFSIKTKDGFCGKLYDLIVDDTTWRVNFIIIRHSSKKYFNRNVLINVNWISNIFFDRKYIEFDLSSDDLIA